MTTTRHVGTWEGVALGYGRQGRLFVHLTFTPDGKREPVTIRIPVDADGIERRTVLLLSKLAAPLVASGIEPPPEGWREVFQARGILPTMSDLVGRRCILIEREDYGSSAGLMRWYEYEPEPESEPVEVPTEPSDAGYLRDLALRLRQVPATYDVDGYDIDRLNQIAQRLEPEP